MDYVLTPFAQREIGAEAVSKVGRLNSTNSIMILVLAPVVGMLTRKCASYTMVIIGGFITALSFVFMCAPTSMFEGLSVGLVGQGHRKRLSRHRGRRASVFCHDFPLAGRVFHRRGVLLAAGLRIRRFHRAAGTGGVLFVAVLHPAVDRKDLHRSCVLPTAQPLLPGSRAIAIRQRCGSSSA